MKTITSLRTITTLVVLACVTAFPSRAKAALQFLDINSAMTGTCVGVDCSVVRFKLVLNSPVFVNQIMVLAFRGSWLFDSVLDVRDGNGNSLGWNSTIGLINDRPRFIVASGMFVGGPVYILTSMSTWDSNPTSHFRYSIHGNTQADGLGQFGFNFDTVAPEPLSVVLLGTGLIGVLGADRRRRRGKRPR